MPRRAVVLVLVLACGPGPVAETGGESEATGVEASTSSAPTSSAPATASSEGGESGAAELDCEAVCAAPRVHAGDLRVTPDTDPASLDCIGEVTGTLEIREFVGPLPTTLRSIRSADALIVTHNDGLVALDGLECLQRVRMLFVESSDELVDVGALAGIQSVERMEFEGLEALVDISPLANVVGETALFIQACYALAILPTFSAQTQLRSLEIWGAGVTDLDGLAGLPTAPVNVSLSDLPALTDITGLSGMWGEEPVDIGLGQLPQLPSLGGLEGVKRVGWLSLHELPQVTTLAPLASLQSVEQLSMSGLLQVSSLEPFAGIAELGTLALNTMPTLTSLAGLENVQRVGRLEIGACSNGLDGLDGLVDLSGLESVAEIHTLSLVGNAALQSFTGLEALAIGPERLEVVDNHSLPADAVAAFVAEHMIADACVDPPDSCCPAF